ncbi:hypothetical protein [Leptospira sarikeiensis]|uniref:Uncharacterized protein n=1 Tax=Leptospira sarikeiensis TaxID=2484943 RepID=A0A4R9K4T5_9LEPT|nr:hypothetical protein [Leptospira sarikeiensis]TGL60538.1 hypothetical protein EHQ64_11935 [Leptospira sarikeiensis]
MTESIVLFISYSLLHFLVISKVKIANSQMRLIFWLVFLPMIIAIGLALISIGEIRINDSSIKMQIFTHIAGVIIISIAAWQSEKFTPSSLYRNRFDPCSYGLFLSLHNVSIFPWIYIQIIMNGPLEGIPFGQICISSFVILILYNIYLVNTKEISLAHHLLRLLVSSLVVLLLDFFLLVTIILGAILIEGIE